MIFAKASAKTVKTNPVATTIVNKAVITAIAAGVAGLVIVSPAFVQAAPVTVKETKYGDDKIDLVVYIEEKEIPEIVVRASGVDEKTANSVNVILDDIEKELAWVQETGDFSLIDVIDAQLGNR